MQNAKNDKRISEVKNPFPGLRPFRRDENHLFFGRESQVSEVLDKLIKNKFIGIVGNSGIGKSSFVNCGILPKLEQDINETKNKWHVVNFRPGAGPLKQMSLALKEELKVTGLYNDDTDEEKAVDTSDKMSELGQEFYSTTGKKLLIYIDQFEEIFRFPEGNEAESNEIATFIEIIINSIKKADEPISFIITIRSDFLGDCSRYPEFTKAINNSQFLIPQMTREEKRAAIVGPVEVMGAKIEDQLIDTILKSIGDRHDQLPLMQHCLMRSWDYWQSVKVGNEAISLSNYEAIGGMEKALSVHANEIFNELDPNKKKICERLFKCITEKGAEGRSVRRPTSIREIAQIADADKSDIIVIVEHFRKPGRTLLTPSSDVILTEETIIDISHESFMRIWEVLTEWLEEEHEAIKEYLRIAEAAEMHQSGKGGLMKSPDLQMALNWQQENNPSKAWGIRHHKAYDRTMQYLAFSEKKFIQEQRLKEKLQKLRLAVFKTIAVVFGLGAIVALAFFFYAQQQRKEAIKLQKVAAEQTEVAKEQAIKAEKSAEDALRQKQKALISEQAANEQRKEAIQQTELAKKERHFAMEQKDKATEAQQKALELRLISIAQSMAVKSLQESDQILKCLSARQAYNIFSNNDGGESDPDIFSALYYAVKMLKGDDFNTAKAHFDNVRSIIAAKNSSFLYSAGSDGQIFKWTQKDEKFTNELIDYEEGKVHKSMAISDDSEFLVVGGNYPYLKLINLNEKGKPEKIKIPTRGVQYLCFTPDGKEIIFLGSENRIMKWNTTELKEIAQSSVKINTIDMDPQGENLVVGQAEGKVLLIDLINYEFKSLYESDTKADITSVKFSDDGKVLAVGDMNGVVKLINPQSGEVDIKLSGHTAMVNQISFSHSGKKLATASFDHSVRIWTLDDLSKQPIILNDHNDWVWSVEFSHNDKYLLAGCRDNLIRTWLLDIDKMARIICKDDQVNRNFTGKEWEDYVAVDLDYECTCLKNKPEVSNVVEPKIDTLSSASIN